MENRKGIQDFKNRPPHQTDLPSEERTYPSSYLRCIRRLYHLQRAREATIPTPYSSQSQESIGSHENHLPGDTPSSRLKTSTLSVFVGISDLQRTLLELAAALRTQ